MRQQIVLILVIYRGIDSRVVSKIVTLAIVYYHYDSTMK